LNLNVAHIFLMDTIIKEYNQDITSTLRLLHLCSAYLPIGAYSYSQGIEWAVEAGWIKNEKQTQEWILGLLSYSLGRLDLPVLTRMYNAWQEQKLSEITYWTNFLLASREAAELQAEDKHLGKALGKILFELGCNEIVPYLQRDLSFATSFALAGKFWNIPITQLCAGYIWSWAENQTSAAVKLVPLGQTAAQRILDQIINVSSTIIKQSFNIKDEDIGALTIGLSIASALHETQHTRLFQS